MFCEYEWTVERYSVLSYDCLQCPFNTTQCDGKDCIAANGFQRSVVVVNRMLPGPSVTVCEGDTVSVKLRNRLHFGEATTVHW